VRIAELEGVAVPQAGAAIGGVPQVWTEFFGTNLGHPARSIPRTRVEASGSSGDHLIRGLCPRTPGLWTLPDLPRPVDAPREQEAARSWRPPAAWESPMKPEIPTGPWKALRAFHSAHRPYDELFPFPLSSSASTTLNYVSTESGEAHASGSTANATACGRN
jgi:hypothetical protein